MELSGAEKLILIMLSEIYEKLGIGTETGAEIDPKFVRKAIFADQLWGLGWKFPSVKESADPPIVDEVMDILGMWSMIESAYDELSDKEKEALKREAEPFGDPVKFEGFDANSEDEYSVAQFLIDDLEKFPNFKGRPLNSLSAVIEKYRRMLEAFKPMRNKLRKKLEGRSLNVAELTEILKTQKYPK